MKPLVPMLMLMLGLAALAGCSAKYGCKGLPDEPACLSATEAYRATEHAPAVPARTEAAAETGNTPRPSAGVAPNPRIDDPTPLRTPAQVMRIWIAPWEDADGDLNVSGYVYTELEPRRWMIGKPTPALAPTIAPLQVLRRPAEDKRRAEPDRVTDDKALPPLYGEPAPADP
jgi:conjugal transfer pilus assembly protein TraV